MSIKIRIEVSIAMSYHLTHMRQDAASLWIVDAIKAVASQLIVWHHFVAYGPMARTVYPYASGVMDWLYSDARQVVQAFLVVGGFLSSRSLAPHPHEPAFDSSTRKLVFLLWRRYLRLAKPYLATLVLAILLAALAREILVDADTPAAPSLMQVFIHVLLIQDIVAVEALSAGVWYVAIDFQLYVLLLLILWVSRRLAGCCRINLRTMALVLVVGLCALSLLWFNRDPSMDEWAFYYFGAYGLGVMVQWSAGFIRKHPWLWFLFGTVVVSLTLEWRSRLVVAMITALLLGGGLHLKPVLGQAAHSVMTWLGRTSYALFLIHYPVILILGVIVARVWPENAVMHTIGILLAWVMSLVAADWLNRKVETR